MTIKLVSKQNLNEAISAFTGFTYQFLEHKGEVALTIGRLAQAGVSSRYYDQLAIELDKLKELGKIDELTFRQPRQQQNFATLCKLLDDNLIEEEVFDLIKNLVLASGMASKEDKEQVYIHEIIVAAKDLTSMDVIILTSCYRNMHDWILTTYGDWMRKVMEESGINNSSLIDRRNKTLVDSHFLENGSPLDDHISVNNPSRLTQLSRDLFKYVMLTNQEIEKKI
jgi:hypothetical protein